MTYRTHHDFFIIEVEANIVYEIRIRGAKPVQVVAESLEDAKRAYLEHHL